MWQLKGWGLRAAGALIVLVNALGLEPPVVSAAGVSNVTSSTTTSDAHNINHWQTVTQQYDCPADFPIFDTFNNASSDNVTAVLWEGASSTKPGHFAVTFTNWDVTGDQQYQITYTCKRYPTVADCGGEGQRICWGAPVEGRPTDFMYSVAQQNCDRGLGLDNSHFLAWDDACKNYARHQLRSAEANDNSHDTRVLDEQAYELGADEPMNLVVRPRTHESYNDRADNYIFPNQEYSLSDQLDAGVRVLDLRARFGVGGEPYLRMSHGDNNCGGCAGLDRPFNYGVEEIGTWLANNPDQVIAVGIGQFDDRTANGRDYVTDPINTYIGSQHVLGPREWCQYLANEPVRMPDPNGPGSVTTDRCQTIQGRATDNVWAPYRWPTLAEMRNPYNWACHCTKQVIFSITGDGNFQDADLLFDTPFNDGGDGDGAAKDFGAHGCMRGTKPYDVSSIGKPEYFANWTVESEARVFPEAMISSVFPAADWPGYIYALHSDIPLSAGDNPIISARPFADQATSVEDLLNCNITPSFDMFMADQYYNGDVVSVSTDHQRRDALVWTWKSDEDEQPNKCAMLGWSDNAFHARDCGESHPVACALPSTFYSYMFREGDPWTWQDPMGKNWRVTANAYTFANAQQGCQREFGKWVFGVPTNKFMENQLRLVNGNHQDVWLAYTNNVTGTQPPWKKWTIARFATISLYDFTVAEDSTVTLQATTSNQPVADLSPVWSWQSGGQSFRAAGATPQFSANGIPAGTLVPVQLSVTDKLGITTTASSTIRVTPAGFSPLDARVFSYPQNTGTQALTHDMVGWTLRVTPTGTGTLMLDVLRRPKVPLPANVSLSPTFYAAGITPDSTFTALKFVACQPGVNTVTAYDSATRQWHAVAGQTFDASSGCITFSSTALSAITLSHLNEVVFGFYNDTTPPWARLFLKTADHQMYLPSTVAHQDVEVIIMANDGDEPATVIYQIKRLDAPDPLTVDISMPGNDSFWLTANGTYSISYHAVDIAGNSTPTVVVGPIIVSKWLGGPVSGPPKWRRCTLLDLVARGVLTIIHQPVVCAHRVRQRGHSDFLSAASLVHGDYGAQALVESRAGHCCWAHQRRLVGAAPS